MKESPDVPPLPLEVVSPEPPRDSGSRRGSETKPGGVPFHPWSAALLLAVDNLWALPDFAVITLAFTVPACFLMVFTGVFFIQHRQRDDSVGKALAKALLLAVIAAVPTSVTGTPVGLILLGWAGIRHPWK